MTIGTFMMEMLNYLTKKERKALEEFSFRLKDFLGKNLVFVKLFGSKVRGDFNKDSDIDILLILR
ncbi:MAG: nucleotidyltransferase domain-containing protein, partial [Nanoarchaeota archaeon]|nr:nucleotidyltransferase domain-containing protein [Nanoarchaeota archaeon]